MNYVASPHFKLNSQPACFHGFLPKMTKWGSHFLLKPARSPHWAALFVSALQGKRMLVIWVWVPRRQRRNSGASYRGVWCQGLLCVPLFVWVCQSMYWVLCSGVYLVAQTLHLPPPPPPHERASDSWARSATSELVYCSSDEAKVLEDGGFGWITFSTCFQMDAHTVARWHRMWWNKVCPGIHHDINTCGYHLNLFLLLLCCDSWIYHNKVCSEITGKKAHIFTSDVQIKVATMHPRKKFQYSGRNL